jgi:hypothetical protein
MSSEDPIKAGRIRIAESTTDVVGAMPTGQVPEAVNLVVSES